jgi:hypothetical protein
MLTRGRSGTCPTGLNINPLVAWLAGKISNPLVRLRFLRAMMLPSPQRYRRRRSYTAWFQVSFLVIWLLFTAPASLPRVRAANGISRSRPAAPLWPAALPVKDTPEIWQVERTDAFETYSNGLRIDNRFCIANRRRSYLAFSATRPDEPRGERRSVPAGIVFHTTESLQAPFESGQNPALKRIGESLLTYVRLKRSYNFVIDRFGRVYRVVRESDAANHAGNSVWSDPKWLYLNLNDSFLGVSFETQTAPGQLETAVNPAQVQSAELLIEMLRNLYGIAAGNCVTHAQVSVNLSNLLVGYHLDWASSFPFEQLGLPDNYALPLPAISVFGFQYDSNFAHKAGGRLSQEAQLAEQILRDAAGAAHLSVPVYRKALQTRYSSRLAAVRGGANGMDQEE